MRLHTGAVRKRVCSERCLWATTTTKSLVAPGTRTRVSIAPGFSVPRCTQCASAVQLSDIPDVFLPPWDMRIWKRTCSKNTWKSLCVVRVFSKNAALCELCALYPVSFVTCIPCEFCALYPVSFVTCILWALWPVNYLTCILWSLWLITCVSFVPCILSALWLVSCVSFVPCILWALWLVSCELCALYPVSFVTCILHHVSFVTCIL